MLKKRIIISLTFMDGILYRTKKFKPDYRYTKNFVDLWSIDELILIDISKKKNSKSFLDIVNFFSKNCFVPISVGGGIESLNDVDIYFRNGADKIIVGTKSFKNRKVLKEISKKYGNQSIIQSLDCKKLDDRKKIYTIMTNSGTVDTRINPIDFAKKSLEDGAGEILINNIDNDGSLLGFDLDLIDQISKSLSCPILIMGGAGNWEHFLEPFSKFDISAVCTQNIFHFTEESVNSLKTYLDNNKINIRK